MMYRIFNAVLVLMFAISLMSCGGGGNSQPAQKSDTQPKPEAEKEEGFEKGDAEQGKGLYVQFCSACHGQDGLGLKGLGKDLVHSEFMAGLSDEEMLQYVIEGRTVDDPRNTTGIPMPPRGGNPALTDQQIVHIIAYLRTIQDVDTTKQE